MLRTLYVVADIFITEVRRTSQRVRIRIHIFTPNKCIFFSSVSFVCVSVIALPTACSVYILHCNVRVRTNVYGFLAFLLRLASSFFFSPSLSRYGYSILFVFLRLCSTRSCYIPPLWGGVCYK